MLRSVLWAELWRDTVFVHQGHNIRIDLPTYIAAQWKVAETRIRVFFTYYLREGLEKLILARYQNPKPLLGLGSCPKRNSFLIYNAGFFYFDGPSLQQDILSIIAIKLATTKMDDHLNLEETQRAQNNWQQLFSTLILIPDARKPSHQLMIPVITERVAQTDNAEKTIQAIAQTDNAEKTIQAIAQAKKAAKAIQVMLNRLCRNDAKFGHLTTSVHQGEKFVNFLKHHKNYEPPEDTNCIVTLNNLPMDQAAALRTCHELFQSIIKHNGYQPYTVKILADTTHTVTSTHTPTVTPTQTQIVTPPQPQTVTQSDYFVNANVATFFPAVPSTLPSVTPYHPVIPVTELHNTLAVTIHFYSDAAIKGNIIIPIAANINQPLYSQLIEAWDWIFAIPAFQEITTIISAQQVILAGINSSYIVDLWLTLLRYLPNYQGTNTTLELIDLSLLPSDAHYSTTVNVTLLQDKIKIMMMGAHYNYTAEHEVGKESFSAILAGMRITENRMQSTLTQFGHNRQEFYATLPLALQNGLFGRAAIEAQTAPALEQSETYPFSPSDLFSF